MGLVGFTLAAAVVAATVAVFLYPPSELPLQRRQAVTELATTMADVAVKREEVASSTAEWVTDFSSKMDELTAKMEGTVDGLNLDAEAAEAAHSTIQAYADSILANKTSAVSAATQIADAVEAALAAMISDYSVI